MKSFFVIFFCGSFMFQDLLWASEAQYEEVSYEELVSELNSRVRTKNRANETESPSDPFERVSIQTSFGLVNSIHFLNVGNKEFRRFEDGFSLGFGIDLFNPLWMAEANLINYGHSTQQDQTFSLREFELRLNYKENASQRLSYRIIQGLGAKYLRFSSPILSESIRESTPEYIIGTSINSRFAQNFSLGIELTASLALVNETVDRNSLNLNLKFDNFF